MPKRARPRRGNIRPDVYTPKGLRKVVEGILRELRVKQPHAYDRRVSSKLEEKITAEICHGFPDFVYGFMESSSAVDLVRKISREQKIPMSDAFEEARRIMEIINLRALRITRAQFRIMENLRTVAFPNRRLRRVDEKALRMGDYISKTLLTPVVSSKILLNDLENRNWDTGKMPRPSTVKAKRRTERKRRSGVERRQHKEKFPEKLGFEEFFEYLYPGTKPQAYLRRPDNRKGVEQRKGKERREDKRSS